jgi:hypothetical protein
MTLCNYFPWSYLTDRVYRTSPHAVQEVEVEIDAVTKEITGDMLCGTVDNFEVRLQWNHEDEGSHTENMFT